MANYVTRLKGREEVAEGTFSFHFEKPEGFDFKAGQFLNLSLIDPPETDDRGYSRMFSIASAPSEPDLMIATRIRETAFKRVLKAMPEGSEIKLGGPFGKLTLEDAPAGPVVMLAGGIGITPFRSILLEALNRGLSRDLFLFYSNRRAGEAAFLKELAGFEKVNPNYKLIATITAPPEPGEAWQGETGRISKDMLNSHLADLAAPVYYIAGPAAMNEALRTTLAEAGVNDDRVRIEKFGGY